MSIGASLNRVKGDRVLWIVIVILTAFSMLVVYSSTGALAFRMAGGNTSFYIMRQALFQGLGFVIILTMLKYVPVNVYNKVAFVTFISAFGLVFLGILFRSGDGSGRTIPLGFMSFQPAELAKVALVMWVARVLATSQKDDRQLNLAFVKIVIGVGALCMLIAFVNFSSAALLFATALIMMIVGRIKIKNLIGLGGAGLLFVATIYFVTPVIPDSIRNKLGRLETVHGRIDRFFKGDKSSEIGLTQAEFAKVAIHRGGLIGEGPGNSLISNFMSASYSDFIYSIIIEEYGFLFGGLGIMILYIVFLTRGGIIVRKCSRTFPAFLATGVTALIVLQAMINMAVSSGAIPVTGQPLPWVSWGGTSQLFTAFAFGMLLSVSAENEKAGKQEVENNFNPEGRLPDEDIALQKAE
jgi:cell division protein FtsW